MTRSPWLYQMVVRLWPLGRILNRAATLPGGGRLLRPLLGPRENQSIIIPVHRALRGLPGTLPCAGHLAGGWGRDHR